MSTRVRIPHSRALDGVRGAAVAAVLLFHGDHLTGGYLGVDLFFVLSGFVLTRMVSRPGFTWRSYYPSRLVRLYLPVWGAVVLAFVIFHVVPHHASVHDAAAMKGIPTGYGLSDVLKDLNQELNKADKGTAPKPAQSEAAPPVKPIPVEIHQPEPAASETLAAIIRPLISPLTTTGIVVVFVIFFLFQREDLRNRFIRLTGTDDLERTTTALDDAGHRLTRLFATQLALNACFGTVIGIGLFLIGVPSAPLWGLLAMILRFVPYLGASMAGISTIAS